MSLDASLQPVITEYYSEVCAVIQWALSDGNRLVYGKLPWRNITNDQLPHSISIASKHTIHCGYVLTQSNSSVFGGQHIDDADRRPRLLAFGSAHSECIKKTRTFTGTWHTFARWLVQMNDGARNTPVAVNRSWFTCLITCDDEWWCSKYLCRF